MPKNTKANLTIDRLALLAANGDDKSMATLVAKITPVAKAKASKLGGPRLSAEDLVQEGMLGFLDAVKSFKCEKGVPFKSYAEKCINNRMLSAVRKNSNKKNAPLTNAVPIEENSSEHLSVSSDPAVIFAGINGSEHLRSIIETDLSDFEKKVIRLRLLDKSYAQIAASLDCSEKAVDNALQRIRKKIRSKL